MGPVLVRYGFSGDKRGSAELRAVIADLANHNKDIRSMNMDIQKLVISLFPDLKSDQAEAAQRAASASTAVSATEDSPKSNDARRLIKKAETYKTIHVHNTYSTDASLTLGLQCIIHPVQLLTFFCHISLWTYLKKRFAWKFPKSTGTFFNSSCRFWSPGEWVCSMASQRTASVLESQIESTRLEPRHGCPGRYGAQEQPIQEGAIQVPLEVEEEAHSTTTKEAPQDETALKVSCAQKPKTRISFHGG
eukprot:symbB.v1.2.037250.t1/scaffold5442.1/size27163/4